MKLLNCWKVESISLLSKKHICYSDIRSFLLDSAPPLFFLSLFPHSLHSVPFISPWIFVSTSSSRSLLLAIEQVVSIEGYYNSIQLYKRKGERAPNQPKDVQSRTSNKSRTTFLQTPTCKSFQAAGVVALIVARYALEIEAIPQDKGPRSERAGVRSKAKITRLLSAGSEATIDLFGRAGFKATPWLSGVNGLHQLSGQARASLLYGERWEYHCTFYVDSWTTRKHQRRKLWI